MKYGPNYVKFYRRQLRHLRKSDPHFVRVDLEPDGSVLLTDDDGEVFHVGMHRGRAWPDISRRMRRFEQLDAHEEREANRPPPSFGPPRLVS